MGNRNEAVILRFDSCYFQMRKKKRRKRR